VSYVSTSWHREQLRAAIDAGIDFLVIPHAPHPEGPDATPSGRGIPFLVAALDEALAEQGRAPRLGLLVDTTSWAARSADGWLDLGSPRERDLLYEAIAEFARRVPPRHRACIDGRMLVVIGPAVRVLRYRSNLFDYLRARFARANEGAGLFLVRDGTWDLPGDAAIGWGGALAGPVVRDFAVIGPGYDDSRRPGGVNPVRDREGGRFYEKSWIEILASDADVVLIRSWNGLHEGTAVCETREFGRRYLDLTAEYARLFREGRRVERSVRLEHPNPRPRPDLGWGREAAGGAIVTWQGDFGFRADDGIALGTWPDGPVRLLTVAGDRCAMTLGAGPSTPRYVYFLVSDYFLFDSDEPVVIELLYHDSGGGTLSLQYDAAGAAAGSLRAGAYTNRPTLVRAGEDRWTRARWEIPDARFANRQNGHADFRLRVDGTDLVFREVIVRKAARGGEPDPGSGATGD
jgi:hypothetical protein